MLAKCEDPGFHLDFNLCTWSLIIDQPLFMKSSFYICSRYQINEWKKLLTICTHMYVLYTHVHWWLGVHCTVYCWYSHTDGLYMVGLFLLAWIVWVCIILVKQDYTLSNSTAVLYLSRQQIQSEYSRCLK